MSAVGVGAWALRLAVAAGLVALVAAGHRRVTGAVALAVTTVAVAVATIALAAAFWSSDFSLAYVADHARRDASSATRVSGLWGGMGGSLLLYALGSSIAALIATWRAPAASRALVAAVGGAVTASLAGFVAAFADPFDRLEVPATDGAGLTPILEHPAMLYHPPLVYAGLTALTAALALTVSALARDQLDDQWRAQLRRWLVVPWTLLAVGMLAGAHWAYVELGWGGYWAWDPVENTALLPWLAVTAALHALQPRDGEGRAGTAGAVAGLVGAAYLLALLGGLLTRSGATMSVHAFGEARSIGRAFAVLLVVTSVGFAALAARHRRRAAPSAAPPPVRWPPTRSMALRLQHALVLAVLAVVLVGSVWPLVADLRGGRSVAVDGTFFAAACGPLAVALLLVMAVGPSLGRLPIGTVALAPSLGAALGVGLAALDGWTGLFALATAAAGGAALVAVVVGAVRGGDTRRRAGSHLAHLGAAVFLLGVAGTTTGATETVSLAEGGSVEVQGRTVTNHDVTVVVPDGGDSSVVATVEIDGHRLEPRLVSHARRNRLLAESALRSTWHEDLQVMLRDARDDGRVVVQVGIHPLQQLVWWGGLLLVAGGVAAYGGARVSPAEGRDRRPAGGAASRATSPASRRAGPPAPDPPLGAPDATAPPARA